MVTRGFVPGCTCQPDPASNERRMLEYAIEDLNDLFLPDYPNGESREVGSLVQRGLDAIREAIDMALGGLPPAPKICEGHQQYMRQQAQLWDKLVEERIKEISFFYGVKGNA